MHLICLERTKTEVVDGMYINAAGKLIALCLACAERDNKIACHLPALWTLL